MDLRDGEVRQIALVGGLLFTIIAAHIMLETARDALFLGALPAEYLTLVYAGLAGLVLVALSLNRRLVRRVGRRNALVGTLMAAGYGTVFFYLLPRTHMAVIALYVWSGLLGTVLVVQFWMLAGQYFTVAQGKRLFGLVTAGGALGAFAGAASAAAVVEFLPVDALLPIAAGLFLGGGFLLTGSYREEILLPPPEEDIGRESARTTAQLVRRSSYLRRMVLLVVLATAAALVTDYLFKSVASREIAAADLGVFFARFYTVLNAAALLIQLVGAARVVRRVGVVAALTVMPLLLFAGGAATFVLGGAFATILLTKGTDGVLRHSLHRVATELLWMPHPPDQRERAKGAIDGVLARVAQALTAGLLLLLAALGVDHAVLLSAILAGFALAWLLVAASMRGPYLSLFRSALSRPTFDPGEELDLRSVEVLVEALSSTDDQRVIAALEILDAKDRSRLIPALILYHESVDVLVKALRIIAKKERRDWIALTRRLLTHESNRVRIEALRVMAKNRLLSGLEARLSDIDPAVRAHAAFWLAEDQDTDHKADDPRVRAVIEIPPPRGRAAHLALLEAIREDGGSAWASVIEILANTDEPDVGEAAALAMQRAPDPRFLPVLIKRLGVRSGRGAVRAAIVAIGESALDAAEEAFRSSATSERVRMHLPRTISRFACQRAADFLFEQLIVEPYGMIRYKILRGLALLVKKQPVHVNYKAIFASLERNLREYFRLLALYGPLDAARPGPGRDPSESLELLVGLLGDKLRQALERTFMLLQIAHRNEDLQRVYFAVRSADRNLRAHAHEFVDALTRNPIYARANGTRVVEWLRIVGDDMDSVDKVARAGGAVAEVPRTDREALSLLLRDEDPMVASIAAFHALEIAGAGGFQGSAGDDADSLRVEVFTVARERPILKAVGEEAEEQFHEWEAKSGVA